MLVHTHPAYGPNRPRRPYLTADVGTLISLLPGQAQFGAFKRKARAAATQPVLPTVVPEPSYNVPAAFFAVAGVLVVRGDVVPAAVVGVLGGALTVLVGSPAPLT